MVSHRKLYNTILTITVSFQSDGRQENDSSSLDQTTVDGSKKLYELFSSDNTHGENECSSEENANDANYAEEENVYIGFFDFH